MRFEIIINYQWLNCVQVRGKKNRNVFALGSVDYLKVFNNVR